MKLHLFLPCEQSSVCVELEHCVDKVDALPCDNFLSMATHLFPFILGSEVLIASKSLF